MLSRLSDKFHSTAATFRVFKQTLTRSHTLLAGPYTGELGWELMEWSGYIRKLSPKYKRTIIISYPGHSCLYDGCEFYPHDRKLEASGYWYGSLTPGQVGAMTASYARGLKLTSFDWLHPTHLNRYAKSLIGAQLFWPPFDRSRSQYRYDVAFHFRSIRRADLDEKNYPLEYANELVRRCRAQAMRVCCIGHPLYALSPPDCDDLRSSDLGETRNALKAIKVVVGGSSAPIHLASVCGLPIVVWWKAAALDTELRDRYLASWNPHNAPVFVVSNSNFQPSPGEVFSNIVQALGAGSPQELEATS